MKWDNVTNEEVMGRARAEEYLRSTNGNPPPILDPFCGGGSIPLEANAGRTGTGGARQRP